MIFSTVVLFLQCIVLSQTFLPATGFSSSSPPKNFLSAFTDLFENKASKNQSDVSLAEREKLKADLVELCDNESMKDSEKRNNIESLIAELREISPIKQTATSPLLQKKWLLLWTTEKEINFFIDWNLSGQITQTLNNEILENNIPFQRGGSFGVTGKLSIPDDDDETINASSQGLRTEFEFEVASLDLGKWGEYSFPPVGKGWFDTVYLDESFRIDLNSRNDILICESD